MTSDSAIFRDLAYVFGGAVGRRPRCARLQQHVIVGYALAGALGPFTPGPTVFELHILELFAEIGVIFLMYSIGMEFPPKHLLSVRWVGTVGGFLGVVAILALGVGVGSLMNWPWIRSIAVTAAVSLANSGGSLVSLFLLDRASGGSGPHTDW